MIQQGAAGLLLDPGLGKTSIALAAFKILKDQGFVNRALVIAPVRPVYDVWPQEVDKWANFNTLVCSILHGPDKDWQADNPEGVDLFLINPEGLKWLLGFKRVKKQLTVDPQRLKKLGVDMLIIDESTKFKNSTSDRFKMLRKVLGQFKRRYILTGTVAPNGLEDLFGQMFILDGGHALGAYITHYRRQFFNTPNPHNPYDYEPNPGAFEEIAERISPLTLQLSAEDYLQMPDLYNVTLTVDLPPAVRKQYDEVEDEFITKIGEELIVAANAGAAGTKCRQIANGAVYISKTDYVTVHDAKLDALEDLVEELAGAPLLVLYEYKHDLERLQARFKNGVSIGSGVSERKTSSTIKAFNAGRVPLLFGHPASMGHGSNLQGACRHVCWFGITWNYEYYDQAIARVYRQGQKAKSVFVYHIVAANTLDEKVMWVLIDKEKRQQKLFDLLVADY